MTAITFDTLKFANRLKAAGIPSAYAEAEAAALSEVLDINLGELATRTDLARMASKTDLDAVRADLAAVKNDVAGIKAELAAIKVEMATKADLVLIRTVVATLATKEDLAAVKAEVALLRKDMEAMEYRLTIRLGVVITAAMALLGTFLKLF